jgi:hypothetical protein
MGQVNTSKSNPTSMTNSTNESATSAWEEQYAEMFYDAYVGPLTATDIAAGITRKMIYEADVREGRRQDRHFKLIENLEKYGEEIFSGYARTSLPSTFAEECKNEIVERAKQVAKGKGNLDDYLKQLLCPQRESGFKNIAAKEKGKRRGLAAYSQNLKIFPEAMKRNYLIREPEMSFCTKSDIYNFNADDVMDEVNELIAIRMTLQIWKRKKRWPELILSELLMDWSTLVETNNDRVFELQRKFEQIYLLVLDGGRDVKLPRMKFFHQKIL